MHWLAIVLVLAAVVAVAWLASQKSTDSAAHDRVALLAAKVGGIARDSSVLLTYNGLPAEGAVEDDRSWERSGNNFRLNKQYVWKVRLVTPQGSRAAYYQLASLDHLPGPNEFLAQLEQLSQQDGQG